MDGLRHLLTLAQGRGDRIAIRYGTESLSYRDLAELSARLAGGLSRLGIARGDRVAFWLPNVPAYLLLVLACARLGAIATAVNTRYRANEVGDIIGRSGAKLLILWPRFLDIQFLDILSEVDRAALARLEHVIIYSESGEQPPAALPLAARMIAYEDLLKAAPLKGEGGRQDGAAIFTTSGTTKAPKFVLHRQSSLIDHAAVVAPAFGYDRPGEKVLQAVPFCGVFGFAQAMAGLFGGAELALMPVFKEAAALALLRTGGVTQFNGTDDMLMRLLDAAEEGRPFPKLRFVGFAAFSLNPADVVAAGDAKGVACLGLYGMSEVQALFARQDEGAAPQERAKAGGKPVSPTTEVRVRDPESGKLLAAGEAGELELKGPSLMAEYYDNPDATREAFTADGFLRSGDLGQLDSDGRFIFLTRMGDVLRLGGFLVSPAEIEEHIASHPAVAGAQVVGAATSTGTRAVAFVVRKQGASIDETAIQTHCRAKLAGFKTPARVVMLDEFPVTLSANGVKIQRAKLREMANAMMRA